LITKKRPFLYKIIIFSLLIIAVMGWLRVYQSIYQWEWLIRYAVFPGPWYSLITGVLIGVIATLGVVVGWLRLNWSAKYIQIIVVLLSLGWWLDYLLFSQSSIAFYNLPFRIVVNLLYLIFVVGYFYLTKVEEPKGMKDEKR
jgi:hypothetical protein